MYVLIRNYECCMFRHCPSEFEFSEVIIRKLILDFKKYLWRHSIFFFFFFAPYYRTTFYQKQFRCLRFDRKLDEYIFLDTRLYMSSINICTKRNALVDKQRWWSTAMRESDATLIKNSYLPGQIRGSLRMYTFWFKQTAYQNEVLHERYYLQR